MNNSLSARRQVLIKKSGRTIERLAPNYEVVNLTCFSFEVAYIYPFIYCLVILYQPFSGTKGLDNKINYETRLCGNKKIFFKLKIPSL